MPSFSELYESAGERWKPEEGGVYTVCVVEARKGETQNGYPSVNLWLEVVGGESNGERFWDATFFSASGVANGMAFAKLEAVSPTTNEAVWKGNPDLGQIEGAMMGAKFKTQTTYETNQRDPEKPWLRCTYLPISDSSSSDVIDLEAGVDPF